jgi:2-polyprenyl-3-methyl-5-hydroxy-6-metoxy-1,4-benzoquinol methylase
MSSSVPAPILGEMVDYYRARAAEYDEWFYRQGRFDRGEAANVAWFAESAEVFAAFDALNVAGDVLELAPGTGIWTERIARTATTVTAVDASPEMVAINQVKLGPAAARITYVLADLFAWQPEREYDACCFGFWISHVPLERLDDFLATVAQALRPSGKVFFVDGRREPTSTAANHQLPDLGEQVMTRKLNDGRAFQIVKNFFDPTELSAHCAAVGLDVDVRETATYFMYGVGAKRG